MAYLGLDLGKSLGWALWRRGDVVESGVKHFGGEGSTDGLAFYGFRLFLGDTRKMLERAGELLEGIIYESVDFIARDNGIYAAHVYGAMWGNLESWCEQRAIPRKGINVATIKKHVTGHGSAAKPLVTKRIKLLFPHVREHNEADAVAALITARNKFGK
ncbi:MAG TPA: hypothetical protein VK634_17135 [Reyranella sp.]|nr:hypothetical protein [Reyranella sp.]HTE82412.1 hypothetical protein [Reyranella sp.]